MRIEMEITKYEEFKEVFNKLKQNYRRLDSKRYIVCVSPSYITLLPLTSSRHAHVFRFSIRNMKDLNEYEKIINDIQNEFSVLKCEALPE